MKTQAKKTKIKKLVKELLKESHKAQIKKIETALNSGSLDLENWDHENNSMILPKIITTAILEDAAVRHYTAKGTSFERQIKKEVKNLRYFI